jgi:tRNA (mo5U34)-methyltransferase
MVKTLRVLTTAEKQRIASIRWWHRIPIGLNDDGSVFYTPGEVRHGADGEDYATTRFGMPLDLTGKTVLDIGGWDGYFSFEASRRGAKRVVLIDVPAVQGGNWGNTLGFQCAFDILAPTNLTYRPLSVMKADRIQEQFDVVLFYGVLYHLTHPTVAIEQIAAVTKAGGMVLIETAGDAYDPEPTFRLKPGFDNDPSNTWYPTFAGLKLCCEKLFPFRNGKLLSTAGSIRFTMEMERQ